MEIAAADDESRSLRSILDPELTVPVFFESIWQKSCATFPANQQALQKSQSNGPQSSRAIATIAAQGPLASWDEERIKQDPYGQVVQQGWHVLVHLLEALGNQSEHKQEHTNIGAEALLFKNQECLSSPQDRAAYGDNNSLFAAFLDGCSVVVNHADHYSPWIAALCQDLQRSFPHAYANTYLTPAGCQAVMPHADDRDVLVIQVYGSKAWKVYANIPVPYPYPHEQVGKAGLEVPTQVLNGPVLIEKTLHAGDVLYMPRGHVHEAWASCSEPSFHITVALATHDWTLAGLVSKASEKVLGSVVDYRMALPRQHGMSQWANVEAGDKARLQQQLDEAFELLKREITAKSIHGTLQNKFEQHNRNAALVRTKMLQEAREAVSASQSGTPNLSVVVGKEAASHVYLATWIRAATPEEKASVPPTPQPRGLNVRPEIHDGIISILQRLKGDALLECQVQDLRTLLPASSGGAPNVLICDLTLLCFARQCVELGALAAILHAK